MVPGSDSVAAELLRRSSDRLLHSARPTIVRRQAAPHQKECIVNKHFLTPLLLVGVATLGMVSCSSDDESSVTTTLDSTQLIAPVIVDITAVDGADVEVTQDRVLVLNADEPATWTATVADPSVLSFVAGRTDDTADYNPGFSTLSVGTTEVTMTDGTTTIRFTVTVVGKVG